jgi:antitoxin component of MazEF toxin-antitoxin module
MPIIRKLIKVGDSKAVTIPSSWIEEIERRTGKPITEVMMELNGAITIYVEEQPEKA